jgi:formylglycine-generating enzyme required for sulfatase activity
VAGVAALAAGAVVFRPEPLPGYPMVPVGAGLAAGPEGTVEVRPFLMGEREVSQALWSAVVGGTLASRRTLVDGQLGATCTEFHGLTLVGPELPMVCVDFLEAVRFADALSERHGLRPAHRIGPDGRGGWTVERVPGADGYRLPTVAEWRLAITPREGESPAEENGADLALRRAVPGATSDGFDDGFPVASPVGRFPPGPRGVRDGHGNVNEWLWDPDGPGRRWTAAGAWGAVPSLYPFGLAAPTELEFRNYTLGVRLARDLP